jgi:hypothetical protein
VWRKMARSPPRQRHRETHRDGGCKAVKLKLEDRWKNRRSPERRVVHEPLIAAPAPAPFPHVDGAQARMDMARITKWVAAQIVSYPPDRCLRCRRPIAFGARWLELVNDNARARFHSDCIPVWRAQQEALARRALGISTKENTSP